MWSRFRLLSVVCILIAAAAKPASADVVLSGPDANDGTYSTARLAKMVTVGDTVNDGTLTGISLWGLLGGANAASAISPAYGALTTSTPVGGNGKNAILRYYLVATGASGATSVVSLGEIDPSFGGTAAKPAFVAYQHTGGGLLATSQLVVPGAPGRNITNLASLTLLAAPALPAQPGGVASSVSLSGNVGHPGSYTKARLQTGFAPARETISGNTYTGVPLWTFLGATDRNVKDQIVITQGTDGYEVVLSLAELDSSLGGNPNDLLAYAGTGGDFPGNGMARTVFPTDNKHGRWESNLSAVIVRTVRTVHQSQ